MTVKECVFDQRYKLYRTGEFFDLIADPDEKQPIAADSLDTAGSIAASKFGWQPILAVDNDPVAVNQARENLLLNDVTDGIDCQVMDLTQQWPSEKHELVIANIYGGLLMELAPRLIRATGKILILSGIRAIEADAVSAVFAQLGCRELSSDADHEWCGIWLEVPAS